MLILALDTSTQAGSLAFLRDARVIGEVSTWVEETYSSRMFRHIEFLQREIGVDLAQVDVFAVATGPGSFTGLRVGLTAVKGWAEGYGKPVAAVSALEAVAAQARSREELLAPVIDARRGEVYGGLYVRRALELERRGEEVAMATEEFLEFLGCQAVGRGVAFVSPSPEVLAPALARSEFRESVVQTVSTVLAPVIGRIGFARAGRGELVDALALEANYVRRSDAEVSWK